MSSFLNKRTFSKIMTIIFILSITYCQKDSTINKIAVKPKPPKPEDYIDCALVLFSFPCTSFYDPVCAYFNEKVQCIKAPCTTTYTNGCLACTSGEVAGFTPGSCSGSIDNKIDDIKLPNKNTIYRETDTESSTSSSSVEINDNKLESFITNHHHLK